MRGLWHRRMFWLTTGGALPLAHGRRHPPPAALRPAAPPTTGRPAYEWINAWQNNGTRVSEFGWVLLEVRELPTSG